MQSLPREKTRKIKVGNISIGGENKVLIQSMCNIKTSNVREVVAQINECAALGADLMRVSVLDIEDAKAIKEIVKEINIPLIADIHFDYRLAIESINSGVNAIRINPGNIGSTENVKKVVSLCKEKHIPIRVGVNSGSIDKDVNNGTEKVPAKDLIESVKRTIKILEDLDFHDIVISLKGSHVLDTIEAYKLASQEFDYPLHIGVTEAGTTFCGLIKSGVGLGKLLLEGIGDTIRVALTGDPIEEVKTGINILKALNLKTGLDIISCPTCGRTKTNLIEITNRIKDKLMKTSIRDKDIKIAVMGCAVNGPGEARNADFGIACGKHEGLIFKRGEIIKKVPEEELVMEFINIILQEVQ